MGFVKIENDGISDVVGINDIFSERSIETRFMLKDVKNGLDVRMNLKSVG